MSLTLFSVVPAAMRVMELATVPFAQFSRRRVRGMTHQMAQQRMVWEVLRRKSQAAAVKVLMMRAVVPMAKAWARVVWSDRQYNRKLRMSLNCSAFRDRVGVGEEAGAFTSEYARL
mmetsp:Transcript_3685/g.9429  ORF Transcript_3685/g.9429 Transcript_3685/m.9429 type:complete len:116 (-) Transcript_3685:424-771(-)